MSAFASALCILILVGSIFTTTQASQAGDCSLNLNRHKLSLSTGNSRLKALCSPP